MNKNEMVKELYTLITKENEITYKNLFTNTDIKSVSDKYWKESLIFFSKLSKEDREVFFNIIKQVEIDAVSNILGIFDGVVTFLNTQEEMAIISKESGDIISGDLQDLFLEYDELNRK